MNVDGKSRHVRDGAVCFDPPTTAVEPVHTPRALCDVMLDVLGRDSTLRSMYVRRRWQGFEIERASDDQSRTQ